MLEFYLEKRATIDPMKTVAASSTNSIHDVEDGLLEMDHLPGAGELSPQRDHLVKEQLETLYLHLGAREVVEQCAILLVRLK